MARFDSRSDDGVHLAKTCSGVPSVAHEASNIEARRRLPAVSDGAWDASSRRPIDGARIDGFLTESCEGGGEGELGEGAAVEGLDADDALTVSGRVTEVREAQRLNARWLIVATEAGRAMEVRAVPLKARLPILVSAASVGSRDR